MSSFPGGCRFVETGVAGGSEVFSLSSPFGSLLGLFCGLSAFFLVTFRLVCSLVNASALDFFSSSFCNGFCCIAMSFALCFGTLLLVGVFSAADGPVGFIGVSG
jgi:hypothetical protein